MFSAAAGVFHERGVGGGEWLGLLDALVPRPPSHEEHQDAGHHPRRLERHPLLHRATPVEALRRCRFVTAAVLGRFFKLLGAVVSLVLRMGDFLLSVHHYCPRAVGSSLLCLGDF